MSDLFAKIADTFFNSRPAPKRMPARIRIVLSADQLATLTNGAKLRYTAHGTEVQICLAQADRKQP